MRGVVAFEIEGEQIVRGWLGEIDETVGLLERIAGAGKMIRAPFQAERLGHHLARLKQLARHRKAFPQCLAEFDRRLVAVAEIGRRQPVGGLVDEADNALVGGKLRPVDGIVFIGVDHQRAVAIPPRLGKVRGCSR
ncbi:hypothetical protein X768_27515 [Mesorhizobium sp. LSJC265A00]|nr:hypothetical protein X768_27515 [Mesorhizobium sp. LSJC265A00]